ncbi:anthranilate phosphoribosyltransferase [Brytella acorum]|uniref:Anthranilate phosphoribosyltransferase n=1 Tax=Brytella acorum TaxID=2959299 RepID=A0AA35VAP1_9PROT|nr:anthranilate phosphoribosyltransferase [Brytella acorum]MDF3623907.1 anthranilate phosphoribosyltransferase [Brytella acorum]CAI9120823.1 anthranilate phosphoribosyltransferase [Brytella acorum]
MSEDIRSLLRHVISGQTLDEVEAERFFFSVMAGSVPPVQLAAVLTALHMRGETEGELLGAVRAARRYMLAVEDAPEDAIDVCGTGGDGLGTLNISTATAFVLAGMGIPVAKHGNRALSSQSGATDVLQVLGIEPEMDPARQGRRLAEDGLAFLVAPAHHPAMRHAAEVRRALGFRTLFNLVGPLCNPARVKRQVIGVFDARWLDTVARTLGNLGSVCVWAVHGTTDQGGADELTLAGPSQISAWEGETLRRYVIEPAMAGLKECAIGAIAGGDPAYNADALRALLDGAPGAYRDTVLLNAAVALHVAGRFSILEGERISTARLTENAAFAARALDSGAALEAFRKASS